MLKNLFLLACCVFWLSIPFSLQAQSDKKVRLVVTDVLGTRVTKIDTILPPYADTDKVLKQLGYDPESVAKAYGDNSERRISVKTEELLDADFWNKKRTEQEQALKKNEMLKLPLSNKTSASSNKGQGNGQIYVEEMVGDESIHIPPGAKVEETSEGKRITTTRTDSDGTVYTETILIGKPTTTTSSSHGAFDWNERNGNIAAQPPTVIGDLPPLDESKIPPPPKQVYHAPPANLVKPGKTITESFEHTDRDGANAPRVNVTFGDLDMFDHSSIQKKQPDLLNFEPLSIKKLTVSPDFAQGYFRFSFETPDEGIYALSIFDVLGTLIYNETITGTLYSKLIPSFHVYKKGAYLLLLTHDNKKFTQKIILE